MMLGLEPSRREILTCASALLPSIQSRAPQRVVVIMVDGFGLDYLKQSSMPTLAAWRRSGIFKTVQDVMPSVTNTNDASICCGVWPDEHGITGNSYFDEKTGREEYMESGWLVLAPTLFERAKQKGVSSALLSSKHKTTTLLARGADVVISAEHPTAEQQQRLGAPPGVYSREINYWTMRAAADLLKSRRDLGCLYVHTTDYPMHTWPAESTESKEHLAKLDGFLGEAAAAAPDAAFLLTADHGMNHKSRCWDLEQACRNRAVPIRIAISADRDKYVKHHRGFGGAAWVYLQSRTDESRVADVLKHLRGVEMVLTRAEAARRYRLLPSRIGDLVVLGDRDTVFGTLESGAESETLPETYRSHGSAHETEVPLFVYNAEGAPAARYFQHNLDLARWLYR